VIVAKRSTVFSCTECGAQFPKWAGQCSDCGKWNTLEEEILQRAGSGKGDRYSGLNSSETVTSLDSVVVDEMVRRNTGISEFDRVLGGGLVAGSVILIGGDPGIGKSTLLLQALAKLATTDKVLYVTGEESTQQVALRAKRLGVSDSKVRLLAATNIDLILQTVIKEQPDVVVADSVQTLFSDALQSAPGSVAQVRESSAHLVRYAKQTATTVILVGHVTKEGHLAGPRVLEHMVDAVLYFEGDRSSSFRLVRAIKNRFGAVNELGVFAMVEEGLREVTNPSAMFVRRESAAAAGSVILATQEGTRPLLVEVQALVDASPLANPRRLCVGLEQNRMAMLLAVLHRHGGFSLYDQDVFVNVVGGVRVVEPAADLALLAAVVSSLRDKRVAHGTVIFGEVGLSGEIRPVQRGQERLKEASKLGFTRAIIPKGNQPKEKIDGLEVLALPRVDQVLQQLF
tara:strand:- start:3844 stop:5211 length:1368 start_codon:yes stop_codon:yes gene_type:complete